MIFHAANGQGDLIAPQHQLVWKSRNRNIAAGLRASAGSSGDDQSQAGAFPTLASAMRRLL
jgi:hypothetical protein